MQPDHRLCRESSARCSLSPRGPCGGRMVGGCVTPRQPPQRSSRVAHPSGTRGQMTYWLRHAKRCARSQLPPTPTPTHQGCGQEPRGRQEAGEELTSDPGKEPELTLRLSPRVFGAGMELGASPAGGGGVKERGGGGRERGEGGGRGDGEVRETKAPDGS